MKKPLSDETLTNYLFDLLDEEQTAEVNRELKDCPESQEKLKKLQTKFNQLQVLETSGKKKATPYLFLAAAALIALSFIIRLPQNKTEEIAALPETSVREIQNYDDTRIMFLEFYSEQKDTFSLLTRLEAPLKETIELNIPEVRIQYDDENYEIVDLKSYESLNLPSEFIEDYQNNFDRILSLK